MTTEELFDSRKVSQQMTSNVAAIAQGRTALELGLTGVPVHDAADSEAAEDLLADFLESDARVVIVDEAFRGKFSDWMANRLAQHTGLPLVIYCPSFAEEEAGTDAYIVSIVKPAIGFEIRLD
jgi:vacuolar-type H+-ATPase subunit F/Vma7